MFGVVGANDSDLYAFAPSMKHGGGSIMLWGGFSAEGMLPLKLMEGVIDKHAYDGILTYRAVPSGLEMLASRVLFQWGNEPKRSSRLLGFAIANLRPYNERGERQRFSDKGKPTVSDCFQAIWWTIMGVVLFLLLNPFLESLLHTPFGPLYLCWNDQREEKHQTRHFSLRNGKLSLNLINYLRDMWSGNLPLGKT